MMSLTRLSTSGGSVGTNYAYLTARLHASYTTSLLTTGVLRSPKGVGLSFNYSQTAQTAGAAALNSPRAAGLATSATAAVSGSTTNPHSPRNAHTVTPTHKQNATTTKTWIEDVAAATTPRNLTQLNQKRSMSTATNVAFAPSNPTNALHPEVHPVEQLAVSTTAKQDASYSLEEIMDSVIKVYCTSSSPNYLSPWQNKPIRSQTGSGFVIDGKRIITNAHVVADALQVMVRRPGSPVKYPARVVASGHECDLAVIHVDSDEFWEPYLNHPERVMNISEAAAEQQSQLQTKSPTGLTISTDNEVLDSAPPGYKGLEFCDWIPLLQDDVCVIGYPMGGDNACITQGVVSRVEPVLYAHAATHLLAVQIDAAINPGNSGGPAFVDGKVVGVAFQNIQNANNVGYIIPVPIIRHFLNDVDNGGYKVISQGATSGDFVDGSLLETSSPASSSSTSSSSELVRAESKPQRRGFCSLGILCQGTSNATLQRFLGMVPSTVVSKPANGATSVAAIASSAANAMASAVSYAKGLTSAASPQSTPTSQVQDQNGSSHDVANNSSLSTKDMSRQYATAVQPSSAAGSSVSESSSSAAATTTEAPESTSRFNFVRSALPAAFAHAAPQAQASLFNAGQVTTTSPGNMVPETALSTTGLGLTTSSPTFQLSNDPVTGVLVNKVDIYSPCYGVIQRNDVLVAVDGHPIACDGTVAFRGRERIAFDYLISLKYAGDTARLTFLRRKAAAAASIVDGKTPANATQIELIEKDVAMRPLEHLVSVFEYDKLPSYFVFAGVVCVPLTQPFLHEFGKDWFNSAPRELVQLAVQGSPQFPGQEVVLLAQILPADCTFGYSNIQDLQVKAVNGIRVRNLLHFSRLVERAVLRGAEQYEHELDMKRAAAPQLHSSSEEAARRSELTGVSNSSPFKDYMNKARLSLLPAEDRARLKMRGWDANEVDPDDIDPMPQNGAAIAQSPLAEDPYTIVLELSDHRVLVLDVRAAAQQHTRILATHRVPQDRSEGLGL